jgi:predicted nucleic acid-binding protein
VTTPFLLDTGPLVALLDGKDRYHDWARATVGELEGPLLSCEPVITEACFLLRKVTSGPRNVLHMIMQNVIAIAFEVSDELQALDKLIERYANVPMSLADACLVRMAEVFPTGTVVTIDGDFKIYRKNGRQVIPTLMPGS